jgi:SAM-dependent methyltransferase
MQQKIISGSVCACDLKINHTIVKNMNAENETINYYQQNSKTFAESTCSLSFSHIQDLFLEFLPSGSSILDFGCGSGRDSRYFSERGYDVTSTDGSSEMCRYASGFLGKEVKQLLFSELDEENRYDGIWACASILHCERSEFHAVFKKIIKALKTGGILYTSFKYGDFEGIRNGRYFTNFTETTIVDFLNFHKEFKTVRIWTTEDIRPDHAREKWLNLLLQLKC